jgi:hypothetical protein
MLPALSTSIQRAPPNGGGGKALADMSVSFDRVVYEAI